MNVERKTVHRGSVTLLHGAGLLGVLGLLSAFSPLSTDMYLPGLPAIVHDLNADPARVQQTLSAFLLGLGAGQLVCGPLSDRFGRRPPLYTGIGLYLAASVGCMLASGIYVLIAARVLEGLGAAAAAVTARAVVRDVYSGADAARAMSLVVMVMALAPLIAPFIGGQILAITSWRGIFAALGLIALAALILVGTLLPETNDLARRDDIRLASRFRAYGTVLADRRARAWLACGGLTYAALYAYLTGSAFVYIDVFGVDPQNFGIYFAVNVVGLIIGNYLNSRWVIRLGYRRLTGMGITVSLASALVLLGFSFSGRGGLIGIVVPLFFSLSTVGVIAANSVAGVLERFPQHAGTASALFGAFQFGLGSIAGAAVGVLYQGTPVAMATVMVAAMIGASIAYGRVAMLERHGTESGQVSSAQED